MIIIIIIIVKSPSKQVSKITQFSGFLDAIYDWGLKHRFFITYIKTEGIVYIK